MVRVAQTVFSSGELTPSLRGAVTSELYRSGLREASNVYFSQAGAPRKRWGFEFLGELPQSEAYKLFTYDSGETRYVCLVWWESSASTANLWVWNTTDWSYPYSGPGRPATQEAYVLEDYTAQGVRDIHYAQSPDAVYFTSSGGPMYELRDDDGDLSLSRVTGGGLATHGPVCKVFDPEVSISFTQDGADELLTADIPYFVPTDRENLFLFEGALFRPTDYRSRNVLEGDSSLDGGFRTPGKPTVGAATSDWYGPFVSQGVSAASGWSTDGQSTSSDPVFGTMSWTGTRDFEVGDILAMPNTGSGTIHVLVVGWIATGSIEYFLLGDGTLPTTPASVTVYRPQSRLNGADLFVQSTSSPADGFISSVGGYFKNGHRATSSQAGAEFLVNGGLVQFTSDVPLEDGRYKFNTVTLGANVQSRRPTSLMEVVSNAEDGWPATLTFHEGRLWCGGYRSHPSTITGSRAQFFRNWELGADDDDSVIARISSDLYTRVTWMRSAGDLLVGTTVAEYAVAGAPITPSEIGIQRQTSYGGREVQPVDVGHAVLFTTANGARVRELMFREQQNVYIAQELSARGEHLFSVNGDPHAAADPVLELAFMRSPHPIIFCLLESGRVAALSYDPAQQLIAWSGWDGLNLETMAVSRRESEDWTFAVGNGPDGSSSTRPALLVSRPSSERYLDYFATWTHSGTPPYGGGGEVEHLRGVQSFVMDGESWRAIVTPSANGVFDLSSLPGAALTVGVPIGCRVRPQSLEFQNARGVTQGLIRKVRSYHVLLRRSYDVQVSGLQFNPDVIPKLDAPILGVSRPVELDSWVQVAAPGSTVGNADWPLVTSISPYPFEVSSVAADVDYGTE